MSDRSNTDQAQAQNWHVRPLRRVLTEAAEVHSFWDHVRTNDFLAPVEARDLLALWAHLQRFPERFQDDRLNERAERIRGQLQDMVDRDWEQLIRQMLRCPSDAWLEQAQEFDAAWEDLMRSPDSLELDCRAWELFSELDRYSLAAYAANHLLNEALKRDPANKERVQQYSDGLEALKRDVQMGEEFLRRHPDAFLPGALLVEDYLLEYRPDLDEVDWELWLTTLKHGVLEEHLREADEPDTPSRLNKAELASVQKIVDDMLQKPANITILPPPPPPQGGAIRFSPTEYTLAAGTSSPQEEQGGLRVLGRIPIRDARYVVKASSLGVFLAPSPASEFRFFVLDGRPYPLQLDARWPGLSLIRELTETEVSALIRDLNLNPESHTLDLVP